MSKIILFLTTALIVISCSTNKGNFSASGTVESIEAGKDGYTAIIVANSGDKVAAVISRVGMGESYVKLEVGEKVKVFGEKTDLGDKVSVRVTRIKR